MTMPALDRRLAKLKCAMAPMRPARTVQRHVIAAENDPARQARIKAILQTSDDNVFHIFRVIISPSEGDAT